MLEYMEALLAEQEDLWQESGALGVMAGEILAGEVPLPLGKKSGGFSRGEGGGLPGSVQGGSWVSPENLRLGQGDSASNPGATLITQESVGSGELGEMLTAGAEDFPRGDFGITPPGSQLPEQVDSSLLAEKLGEDVISGRGAVSPLELAERTGGQSASDLAEEQGWVSPLDLTEEQGDDFPLDASWTAIWEGEEKNSPLLAQLVEILPGENARTTPQKAEAAGSNGEGISLAGLSQEQTGWHSGFTLENGAERLSISRMDRALERDARRYDGRI